MCVYVCVCVLHVYARESERECVCESMREQQLRFRECMHVCLRVCLCVFVW